MPNQVPEQRFSSRMGFLLSALGIAVGTGKMLVVNGTGVTRPAVDGGKTTRLFFVSGLSL